MNCGKSLAVVVFALATPAVAQTSPGSSTMVRSDCSKTMGELPKNWEGQAYAISGDAMSGVGLKPQLRLWGIRAPNMNSENPTAMRARAALEDMLVSAQHHISCRMVGWGPGCQAVVQCSVTAEWPTGSKATVHDLAQRLAEDGFVYGFDLGIVPDWDKDAGEKVAHFEALARQARKGLWPDWLGETKKP